MRQAGPPCACIDHGGDESLAGGPGPTRRLDRERLEERILNLLSSQNMCVLATSGPDGPLATPVRYYHLDLALMFTAMPTSPKMRNIAADPRVSIG
ncbi:pyridoxamine 5'-phosphate oxidase family protein, partial [Kutzneria kofuensis]|uniref:pyridoxamine 5'-phosphate oxidase family protein n=1 Tax=Kutzneria kofuensis TaxID=103725 RepID=UPI0031E763EB